MLVCCVFVSPDGRFVLLLFVVRWWLLSFWGVVCALECVVRVPRSKVVGRCCRSVFFGLGRV